MKLEKSFYRGWRANQSLPVIIHVIEPSDTRYTDRSIGIQGQDRNNEEARSVQLARIAGCAPVTGFTVRGNRFTGNAV